MKLYIPGVFRVSHPVFYLCLLEKETQREVDKLIRKVYPEYPDRLPSERRAPKPDGWNRHGSRPVNGQWSLRACTASGIHDEVSPDKRGTTHKVPSVVMKAANVPPPPRFVPVSRAHERTVRHAETLAYMEDAKRNHTHAPNPPYNDNLYRADYEKPRRKP